MPDRGAGQNYMGQEEMGVMKCWKSGKNLMILEIKRPWCEPAPVYVIAQKVVRCGGGDRAHIWTGRPAGAAFLAPG